MICGRCLKTIITDEWKTEPQTIIICDRCKKDNEKEVR